MYKVYFNNNTLQISFTIDPKQSDKYFHIHWEKEKDITTYIHLLEKEENKHIVITHKDPDYILSLLYEHFSSINAAGGLVTNLSKEILFIKRLGKWDLPKGKMETGEKPSYTAIREVEEECGVTDLSIIKELTTTFHTYTFRNKRILKKTYWFEMNCTCKQAPSPQIEEDITEAIWLDKNQLSSIKNNTYHSVLDVLFCFQKNLIIKK